jgi:hypothetical protein
MSSIKNLSQIKLDVPDISSNQTNIKSKSADYETFEKKHITLVNVIKDAFVRNDKKKEDETVKKILEERKLKKQERIKLIMKSSSDMFKGSKLNTSDDNIIIEDDLNDF